MSWRHPNHGKAAGIDPFLIDKHLHFIFSRQPSIRCLGFACRVIITAGTAIVYGGTGAHGYPVIHPVPDKGYVRAAGHSVIAEECGDFSDGVLKFFFCFHGHSVTADFQCEGNRTDDHTGPDQ